MNNVVDFFKNFNFLLYYLFIYFLSYTYFFLFIYFVLINFHFKVKLVIPSQGMKKSPILVREVFFHI